MNIKINSNELEKAMVLLNQVVNPKCSMPIMLSCLIRIKAGKVTLTTCNDTVYARTIINASEFDTDGWMCVNAKKLLEACKSLPKQTITLSVKDDNAPIILKHSMGSIAINQSAWKNDAGERIFPQIYKFNDNAIKYILSCADMTKALKRSLVAVAHDEVRRVMCGILLNRSAESVIYASTDGRKLITSTFNVPDSVTDSLIIPSSVANLVKGISGTSVRITHGEASKAADLLSSSSDIVEILIDNRISISFMPIEGIYPNYQVVIPANPPYRAMVSRVDLINSLSRIYNFSSSATNLVALTFEGDTLTLRGNDNELGYGIKEQMPTEGFEGNKITIGLCSTYLKEMASLLPDEQLSISFQDPSRPIVLASSSESEDIVTLLMPMRVDDEDSLEEYYEGSKSISAVSTEEPSATETEEELTSVEEPLTEEELEELHSEQAEEDEEEEPSDDDEEEAEATEEKPMGGIVIGGCGFNVKSQA